LRTTVRAARRGVEVRVLLSSAWYVREENRRIVERLRERAESEDLSIRAKLAAPEGRFEKIHAKGVVVDGDRVLLGSLNWNRESARENREVALVLEGEAVAGYYREVFESDWAAGSDGDPGALPVGSILAVAGVVVLAVLVARRVEFGSTTGVGPE
ncbi:phospholipase, partial [Halobacteriales archaeon QH_3_68_24]